MDMDKLKTKIIAWYGQERGAQAALAKATGYSREAISKLLRGDMAMTDEMAVRLANALSLPIAEVKGSPMPAGAVNRPVDVVVDKTVHKVDKSSNSVDNYPIPILGVMSGEYFDATLHLAPIGFLPFRAASGAFFALKRGGEIILFRAQNAHAAGSMALTESESGHAFGAAKAGDKVVGLYVATIHL